MLARRFPLSARGALAAWLGLLGATALVGCGYTKEEYQLQGDNLTRALAKQRAAETRADDAATELEASKERLGDLEERLRSFGVEPTERLTKSEIALARTQRDRALADLKAREARVIEAGSRAEALGSGLADATGVTVTTRGNLLVVQLASDTLFESKDRLGKSGKETLSLVSELLRSDARLSGRKVQVVGHTDDKPKPAEALALSVSQAKAVLGFFVDEKAGNLPRARLSIGAYGSSDPLAANDSDEARQANRRIELVFLPTPAELTDLRELGLSKGSPTVPTKPTAASVEPAPSSAKAASAKAAPAKPDDAKPAPAKPAPAKPAPAKPTPAKPTP